TFDRITGQPIWPIPEVAVPQTNMPTERTSPTQPIPTNPPPYSLTFIKESDLIDFTPALRAKAVENMKKFRWEQSPYVPPLGPNDPRPGAINIGNTAGGVNWPGSGFDPETATFYTMASNTNVAIGKYYEEEFEQVRADRFNAQNPRKPRWEADPDYGRYGTNQPGSAGISQAAPRPAAPVNPGLTGRQILADGLDGLQITKPPYGVIAGIDFNQGGKLIFSVPHGETPDNVRNHPLLRGMNIPKTGQGTSVGIMVTKTMLVAGESQVTAPQGRARGARLVAYDKKDGHEIGSVVMPAAISGSPMTYSVNGRQYIIVAVSGGNYTGEYIAYALPQSELPRSGN
ncbi:MAG: pyrroloquinoline quinone-dependent dehydrogenase, partial [Vicinamibacterales bacterium]